ncbi:MAG: hypothetical protein HY882_14480 [Deltaproteobacteria bacterium]|nr:hypothetical protein [Deltaproteobacteria bacterium]
MNAELYEGIYYSTDRAADERALNDFLSGVSILGIEEEICQVVGKRTRKAATKEMKKGGRA